MPRLTAAIMINWSNFTALIRGFDMFWSYQSDSQLFCFLLFSA